MDRSIVTFRSSHTHLYSYLALRNLRHERVSYFCLVTGLGSPNGALLLAGAVGCTRAANFMEV